MLGSLPPLYSTAECKIMTNFEGAPTNDNAQCQSPSDQSILFKESLFNSNEMRFGVFLVAERQALSGFCQETQARS